MLVALRRDIASSVASETEALVTDLGLEDHLDYVVYGIVEVASMRTFAVRDQSFAWLMSVPSELFEVIEPEHSDTWVRTETDEGIRTGPREFCDEPAFLEYLADGHVDAEQVFARWRAECADYSGSEGSELMGQLGARLRAGEASVCGLALEDLGFAYARGWLDPRQGIEISAHMCGVDADERIGELMSIDFANTDRAVDILESSVPPLHSACAHRRAWVHVFSQVAEAGR